MAVTFGKRFQKSRARRQKARSRRVESRQAGRTARATARQEGRTQRTTARQISKASQIQSKAEGGFFLPASVQARQDTLLGVGKAAAGVGLAAAGIPALGMAAGGSPFGSGFSTSGIEIEESGTEPAQQSDFEKFVDENMVLIGIAGVGLLLFLTRRK